jgi:hypothetical protein
MTSVRREMFQLLDLCFSELFLCSSAAYDDMRHWRSPMIWIMRERRRALNWRFNMASKGL